MLTDLTFYLVLFPGASRVTIQDALLRWPRGGQATSCLAVSFEVRRSLWRVLG
jgi:hypothetical protein